MSTSEVTSTTLLPSILLIADFPGISFTFATAYSGILMPLFVLILKFSSVRELSRSFFVSFSITLISSSWRCIL